MKIKPLHDYVLIEPLEEEKRSKGGIVLPETVEKEPQQGKVIAVGPGKTFSSGKTVKPEVKKGDTVLFRKYGPDEIKVDEKKYLIAKVEDILAIIG
ncbi:MAG: co-chaperone GroES [Patescibacteria group bacterium]